MWHSDNCFRQKLFICRNTAVSMSMLPCFRNGRGAAPIQWAVIDGCEYSGVTTMQMNEGLDTGDILLTEEVKSCSPEGNWRQSV